MGTLVKVLVTDSDITSLSKIYLGLLDRDYPVEASNELQEILPRMKRFQPQVLLVSTGIFEPGMEETRRELKNNAVSVVIMKEKDRPLPESSFTADEVLEKPIELETVFELLDRIHSHKQD